MLGPATDQAITIGGTPARFPVETAVTVHQGTAFVFASKNPTATTAADRANDRGAFRYFLTGIRLPR